MADYKGQTVFVGGVHYPVKDTGDKDTDGNPTTHADLDRPLRVNSDGSYRDALPEEELHNDMNHEQDVDMWPGDEDESEDGV